jgi:pyruvate/2-oxoglutarate dehydrogenase complex dihydrolipoamide acyltransferase (E2) component
MAESISEGTLKQWLKSLSFTPDTAAGNAGFMLTNLAEVGDYVEQDEDIATIETDKV